MNSPCTKSLPEMLAEFPSHLFAKIMQETPAQPATNLWRAVELAALTDNALPYLRDCQDILDLGCGDGGIMETLRPCLPANVIITGMDPDPAETALAAARGVYSSVITSGAENIPLPESCMDAVISNSVLEHINPVEKALLEISRVLRPGGWFVATMPGPDFHACLRGSWLPWVKREDYLEYIDKRLTHFRYWTAEEWKLRLSDAGLNLTAAHEYLPLTVVRRWELISRLTGGLLYCLAGKKTSPIRIQRKLNLRRKGKMPLSVAKAVSRILCLGLNIRSGGPYGGLLIVARKP